MKKTCFMLILIFMLSTTIGYAARYGLNISDNITAYGYGADFYGKVTPSEHPNGMFKDIKGKQQIEIFLDKVYEDIKEGFNLEDILDDYTQVVPDNLPTQELFDQYDKLTENVSMGSTYPVVLIKKDYSEIIVLYKEEDGTNVMRTSSSIVSNQSLNSNSNNNWKIKEETIKSTSIEDILSTIE